jgi:N-acyl-phosphatidylethanolamine-hydrolysing phospholipase D
MGPQHVNPDEAVRIHREVGSRFSVGVHWGTFELTDEPLDQPPRDLAAARRAQGVADDAFVVLAVGETRRLAPRPPASNSASAARAATPAPGAPAAPAR